MGKNNCFSSAEHCFGCGACFAVCPAGAISINLNSDGFFEAVFAEEKCLSCGVCVKVCPKYKNTEPSSEIIKNNPLYAVFGKDKTFSAESSSAGVASLLAGEAFKEGFKAVGVVYDYTDNSAKTVMAENAQEAKAFKGSKYIQAYTADCYKKLLESSGKFLVFGTPCQIAGLDSALRLKNKREDFILVDCFCHGVPSYILWKNFLKYIDIERPNEVVFRKKSGGWHNHFMEIKGGGKTYGANASVNPFYKLFFSDLLLNKSCYSCGIKSGGCSDIRLGDFWGSKYDFREDGVSAVLIFSEKGKALFEKLKAIPQVVFEEGDKKICVKAQCAFRKTPFNETKRTALLEVIKKDGIKSALALAEDNAIKKFVSVFKAKLPLFMFKYFRFLLHKAKGL